MLKNFFVKQSANVTKTVVAILVIVSAVTTNALLVKKFVVALSRVVSISVSLFVTVAHVIHAQSLPLSAVTVAAQSSMCHVDVRGVHVHPGAQSYARALLNVIMRGVRTIPVILVTVLHAHKYVG